MGRRLKFVFAFQPGPGHWSRMGPIASALRQAGHRVIAATAEPFRLRLGDIPPRDFIAIGPSWEEDKLGRAHAGKRRPLVEVLQRRSTAIASHFFGSASEVSLDLVRLLEGTSRPDLLVFDYTLLGGPPTAEALGLPWAAVFGLTVPFHVTGWPPFGSHFGYARSAALSARYRAIDRSIVRENRKLYAPVQDLWRRAGRRVADPWLPYGRLGRAGIVGSIPECEFPLSTRFPRHIRYVGPLVEDRDAATAPDRELLTFMRRRDGRPLIHVTLGMTYSETAPILRRITGALGSEPVRLIISTGHLDEASIGSALSPSARVLVRRTVPHFDVMSEIDLLICHGGAGTLMKALHFGVPVLVVPLGAEQRSNGARFVHARTGKMLLPARLEAASIQRAVHALLDAGRGYARAAGAMGEKARLAGGARYAASLLEEACERRVTS